MKFIVVFLALGVGAFISVVCGFGMGVFAMMFLPYVMSKTLASSATVSLVSAVQSAVICYALRKKICWKDILFPAVGYAVSSVLCITFFKDLSNDTLKLALGIFLIALSIYFIFFSKGISMKHTPKNGLIAGGLGGVMSSLFGAGGPPVSLYFSSGYEDKEKYLSTIQAYFFFTNIYVTFVRARNGIITKEVLIAAAVGIAGAIVGTYIGKKIFDRINADTMRKATYVLMAVSGIIMVINSI